MNPYMKIAHDHVHQPELAEYTKWRRFLAWFGFAILIAIPAAVYACNYYVAITLGI